MSGGHSARGTGRRQRRRGQLAGAPRAGQFRPDPDHDSGARGGTPQTIPHRADLSQIHRRGPEREQREVQVLCRHQR